MSQQVGLSVAKSFPPLVLSLTPRFIFRRVSPRIRIPRATVRVRYCKGIHSDLLPFTVRSWKSWPAMSKFNGIRIQRDHCMYGLVTSWSAAVHDCVNLSRILPLVATQSES